MTRTKKTNLKIIGATVVSLFSLASLFTGTLAWFAANQAVSATGMSVKVAKASNINILSCYAIRYDGSSGAIAYDISGGTSNITMSEYDYVFTDRNVNTPLFIRMEIANFDTTKNLTVSIPCTGSYKTGNKIDPYLSNVISAKLLYGLKSTPSSSLALDNKTFSGSVVQNNDVVECYQGMLNNAKGSNGTPFVTTQNETKTKTNTINLSLNAADVFNPNFIRTKTDAQNNTINYVVAYIVLDYHVISGGINLIDDYLESYNKDEHELSFTSDISTMALGNGENS